MIGNPWQSVIDWLAERWQALMDILNPINIIISVAAYFASFLPEPDPRLSEIVDGAMSALVSVIRFVSLADYFVHLPLLLLAISIILIAELTFNIYRAWRIIRSAVT
jgi:hypothetical protein